MSYKPEDINKLNRDFRLDIYSAAEAECMEKFPQSQACFDINNTEVDLKTCKLIISEFQKCYKNSTNAKLGEKSVFNKRL